MIGESTTVAGTPNYDDVPLETLRESLVTGQAPATEPVADPAAVSAEAPADPAAAPDATPAATPEQPAEAPKEEAPKEEAPKDAAPADDIAAQVAGFKFTENADADTLKAEEQAYLEMVELSDPIRQMLERRDAQIAELAVVGAGTIDNALQQEHNAAFDGLVSFRKTDAGDFVPNTEPLRQLLRERYPNEGEQLITDILVEPSSKYNGYTKYMEYLRDSANLNDDAMTTLETFLENKGQMPFPSYTPPGIDPKAGEAYWNSPDRDEITERVERANHIIDDPRATEEEVLAAKTDLQKVNSNLVIIQKGLNADAKEQQLAQQSQTSVRDEIVQTGNAGYVQTTLGLLEQGREDLAKALTTVFNEAGAKVTAASFGMLINAALSDSNEYAKDAQKQLTEQGIRIDWNKAGAALNRLYAAEQKIAGLVKMNANPRAVENARGDKNTILLEIKGMNKNLTGQIVATLTKGAGAALQQTLANTPKVPAVRPRVPGDGSPIGTKPNYDDMPLDRLRDVAFGRKPLESLSS